jgi:hypothetical protein
VTATKLLLTGVAGKGDCPTFPGDLDREARSLSALACIAHKSLEIFERCRLGVERLFKSFLTRNGRVNSHGV